MRTPSDVVLTQAGTVLGWGLVVALAYQFGRQVAGPDGLPGWKKLSCLPYIGALNAVLVVIILVVTSGHPETGHSTEWLLGTWLGCCGISWLTASRERER